MLQLTPTIKNILIINLVMFGVNALCMSMLNMDLVGLMGLTYYGFHPVKLYQVFSYVFLENDILNLLLSSVTLYFMGTLLEQTWGAKKFLHFYLLSSVSTGLIILLVLAGMTYFSTGTFQLSEINASDVPSTIRYYFGTTWIMFNIITAVAILFPNIDIYLYFIPIPIKIKYIWLMMVILEVVNVFLSKGQTLSNLYIHALSVLMTYLLVRFYIGARTRYL